MLHKNLCGKKKKASLDTKRPAFSRKQSLTALLVGVIFKTRCNNSDGEAQNMAKEYSCVKKTKKGFEKSLVALSKQF